MGKPMQSAVLSIELPLNNGKQRIVIVLVRTKYCISDMIGKLHHS